MDALHVSPLLFPLTSIHTNEGGKKRKRNRQSMPSRKWKGKKRSNNNNNRNKKKYVIITTPEIDWKCLSYSRIANQRPIDHWPSRRTGLARRSLFRSFVLFFPYRFHFHQFGPLKNSFANVNSHYGTKKKKRKENERARVNLNFKLVRTIERSRV